MSEATVDFIKKGEGNNRVQKDYVLNTNAEEG
jgi:hypothetical protein